MFQRSARRLLQQHSSSSSSLQRLLCATGANNNIINNSNSSGSGISFDIDGHKNTVAFVMLRNFHSSPVIAQQQQQEEEQQTAQETTSAPTTTTTTTETSQQSKKPSVTIFGGSGFVGTHVVKALAPHCSHITVGCRYPDAFNSMIQKELSNNPDSPLKVVSAQEVNVTDPIRVEQLVASADVVINLVGIQYESDNSFVETFVDGTRNIFYAARRLETKHAIHMSVLGSEIDHDSRWLDMVFRADDMSYASFPDVTILRSSLIFGEGAKMFERARSVARLFPVLPLPGSASGAYQPIHVSDVAEAVVKCVLNEQETKSQVYELAGPATYDLKGLMKAVSGGSKATMPIMRAFWDLLFGVSQFLPNPTFTRDHIPLMDAQLVHSGDPEVKTLKDLGIEPKSMEDTWKR